MGKILVIVLLGLSAMVIGAMFPWPVAVPEGTAGAVPVFGRSSAYMKEGDVLTVRSTGGGHVWWTSGSDGRSIDAGSDATALRVAGDRLTTERLVSIPTSVAWRHPLPGQPSAMVVRAAEMQPDGALGPRRMFTALFTRHELPVVSLVVEEGALFDPDTGIYVVGHAALHPSPEMEVVHKQDGRWWKYPGNFHFRGGEWERSGAMQLIGKNGGEIFAASVRIRINGQMTRGFPQHSLRLYFDEAIDVPFFPDGDGRGTRSLVLRASGNDQMYALLRDGLAQRICADEPFLTAASMPCAVYINGAYWGLHQLQQRMDEREIARRYAVSHKEIALLQLDNGRFSGHDEAAAMDRMLKDIHGLDPGDERFREQVASRLDLDGFLHYMAAVMVLDNADWPANNVRAWRYLGKPTPAGALDGRWRFVFNDMDLGLGATAGADAPLDLRLKRRDTLSRLFEQVMKAPALRKEFERAVDDLVRERLLSGRAVVQLKLLAAEMEAEMPRHVARWMVPVSVEKWHHEVERVEQYLKDRPRYVGGRRLSD